MKDPPRFVTGAALISGLGIYLPIGLRGAVFCLFPGIANRSTDDAVRGAGLGFVADLTVCFAWMMFGPVWEPRRGFRVLLEYFLPPTRHVVTHWGSTVPNYVQLAAGLVVWTAPMFAVWIRVSGPSIQRRARFIIHVVGATSVVLASGALWMVIPLTDWSRFRAPLVELSPVPMGLFFLSVFPACALVVGFTIRQFSIAAYPFRP